MVRLCAVVTVTLCWSAAGQCEDDGCAYAGSALLQSRGQAADQVAAAALQEDVAARHEAKASAGPATKLECADTTGDHFAAAMQAYAAYGLAAENCGQLAAYCVSPDFGSILMGLCCQTCTNMVGLFTNARAQVGPAAQKAATDTKCLGITAAAVSYRFGGFAQWPFYPLYTAIVQHAGWQFQRSYNYSSAAGDFDHMGLWKHAADASRCLVTFQGSDHLTDYASMYNAATENYKGVNYIHAGVLSEFKPLFEQVDFSADVWSSCTNIMVAGHSLGGTLAQVFTAVLNADENLPNVDQTFIYGAPSPFQGPAPAGCFSGVSVAAGYQNPANGELMVDTIKVLPAPHKPLNLPVEVWAPTDLMALKPGQLVQTLDSPCTDGQGGDVDLSGVHNGETQQGQTYAALHSGGTYAGLLGCWAEPLVQLFRS